MLHSRRNILVSGGTGSGKTTLPNALIELLPDDERIVAIGDTLELRIERSNCVRFEARGLQKGAVTIRDLVRHALRRRPDHIVVGEVRGGEAADLLQALNTGHDGACGTGGMLTVAEDVLEQLAAERGKQVSTHLYGQEINAETYAICKADLLLKGEGDAADNIVGGPEHSTLSNDAFPSHEFDFMLSNPPYGKSWKTSTRRAAGRATPSLGWPTN